MQTRSQNINEFNNTSLNGCLVIPSNINGIPVTSINSYAFYEYTEITSLIIPNTVTNIESYAFAGCTNLETVIIPDSVTTIGKNAFARCYKLISVTIPQCVCNSETGLQDIFPDSYLNLKNVKIGNSVKEINSRTFIRCPNILYNIESVPYTYVLDKWVIKNINCYTDIHIDLSKSCGIATYAFDGVDNIDSLTVPQYICSTANAIKTYFPCSYYKIEKIIIGNDVTEIKGNVFSQCYQINSVIISDSVTTIRSNAFSDCVFLESVTIPESVEIIEANAFPSKCNVIQIKLNAQPKLSSAKMSIKKRIITMLEDSGVDTSEITVTFIEPKIILGVGYSNTFWNTLTYLYYRQCIANAINERRRMIGF